MANKVKKKSARARLLSGVALAVLVIAAALLIFLYRDKIGGLLGAGNEGSGGGEPWAFEAGSSQVFAPAGNGLAVASSTGLQLLDADGLTVARDVCSLDTPAVAACGSYAVAYDVGGTALRAADFEGNVKVLDTENAIISVRVNGLGYMAVTTEEPGYRGLVTVYDAQFAPIYEWYSGEGYLLSADVSPDGKSMAALTAAGDGGYVHIFSLSSEDEKGSYQASGELLVDACWLTDSRLCAVSETRAVFLDDTGAEAGAYDYGGLYLTDLSFGGDGFVALGLSKYLSGSASLIVALGDGGDVLGQTEPASELKSLTAGGRQVLALFSDGLRLYSQAMDEQGSEEDVQGVKTALLRKKGDVLLIYSGAAQIKSY